MLTLLTHVTVTRARDPTSDLALFVEVEESARTLLMELLLAALRSLLSFGLFHLPSRGCQHRSRLWLKGPHVEGCDVELPVWP
jgi:hypothetical protein